MTSDAYPKRHRLRESVGAGGRKSAIWFEKKLGRVSFRYSEDISTTFNNAGGVNWDACSVQDCLGKVLPQLSTCFAHSTPSERKSYLTNPRESDARFELDGVKISQALWDEVAQTLEVGRRSTAALSFLGSEVDANINVKNVSFDHWVNFHGAILNGKVWFEKCRFLKDVSWRHAFFDDSTTPASFVGSTFCEDTSFDYSRFASAIRLEDCSFEKSLSMKGVFGPHVILKSASIHGHAGFHKFKGTLSLVDAALHEDVDFSGAEFNNIQAERMRAPKAHQLGTFVVDDVNLHRARFGARIQAEVTANTVDLSNADMSHGGLLRVENGVVNLENIVLGGPLRIDKPPAAKKGPELIGMQNADGHFITLAHTDVSRCSFQGVHGLDELTLEHSVTFGKSPWWARGRIVLADEYGWRDSAGSRMGWNLPNVVVAARRPTPTKQEPVPPALIRPVQAGEVASIYRDLRRCHESRSNMPAAADFYFGEMEMRKHSKGRSWGEYLLLWLYWLSSGYGLRPVRALAWWLVLVVWGAMRFLVLDNPGRTWTLTVTLESLLRAVRLAIPGFPLPAFPSHPWIETALRFFGATLLALFVVSARSTVMRKPSE